MCGALIKEVFVMALYMFEMVVRGPSWFATLRKMERELNLGHALIRGGPRNKLTQFVYSIVHVTQSEAQLMTQRLKLVEMRNLGVSHLTR